MTWRLDELAHAGPEHLDADYVAAYDKKSPTDWSDDIAMLQALGIGTTSTVVDLGAGTRTFAPAIQSHVARVVAVDVSEPMVARCGRAASRRCGRDSSATSTMRSA